jgi:excisionase family DNA binding protein
MEVAQVDDEVLDVREAATLLGVGEDVVIEEAANGNLPARRIGGKWRFARSHLLGWLRGDAGAGDIEPPPGRRTVDGQQDLDRLLAAQPDEPPTPAEQAARDENDALGDRWEPTDRQRSAGRHECRIPQADLSGFVGGPQVFGDGLVVLASPYHLLGRGLAVASSVSTERSIIAKLP